VNRAEKIELVEQLNQEFSTKPHIVLASFKGLTVNQANALRRKISGIGGAYRVIPNRLAKRAAAGTGAEGLSSSFSGPCAIATHQDNPVALAKAIFDFAKENPQVEMLAGLVDAREVIDQAGVKQLASMPSLPELQAQLLALIQTPATTLVRLLGTPGSQLARVLDARREQQESAS
jgi:large subunit ribosomal protein L10